MASKRLSTPEPVATPEEIIGAKGAKYQVESIEQCDRHVRFLTARIRRYQESSRFENLVELLMADRDQILDRRREMTQAASGNTPKTACKPR